MAGKVVVCEGMCLPKSILEMSKDGDEPPPQFVPKETSFGSEVSSTSTQLPIIDVSLLSSEVELHKLRCALSTVGCFQAIGHGMSSSFLDKIREVAKQFFALPAEEKKKYGRAANEYEGHGNDKIVAEKQVLDWNYRFILKVFPKDERKLDLWPQNPTHFSEILEEYGSKVKSMADLVLKSMAKSLNLEEGSFLKQFGDRSMVLARFNFYPPCSRPDLVFGVKPHSDKSFTVLLQDTQVEGLQVLIDHRWVKVDSTIPDALLVNLGDHMQIMSNGIFKSPLHRVVTNTEKLRISLAMFKEPEADKEIGPVDALIDQTRPRLYKNVINYGDINYKSYQEGKIPLESVRIKEN